jgi:hypothetical protein
MSVITLSSETSIIRKKYENRIQSVEIKFKGNSEIATFKYEER